MLYQWIVIKNGKLYFFNVVDHPLSSCLKLVLSMDHLADLRGCSWLSHVFTNIHGRLVNAIKLHLYCL